MQQRLSSYLRDGVSPGHLRQPGYFLHRGMHTPRLFRGILCLWHSPVLGRPMLVPGYTPVDPALRDEDDDISEAWLQYHDVTRVQLGIVRQDPSSQYQLQ